MDYILARAFCRKWSLEPIQEPVGENWLYAKMPFSGVTLTRFESNRRSGRLRCEAMIHDGAFWAGRTTTFLGQLQEATLCNGKVWPFAGSKLSLVIDFRAGQPRIAISMGRIEVLDKTTRFFSPYFRTKQEHFIRAGLDVMLGKDPPEMFLDWLIQQPGQDWSKFEEAMARSFKY